MSKNEPICNEIQIFSKYLQKRYGLVRLDSQLQKYARSQLYWKIMKNNPFELNKALLFTFQFMPFKMIVTSFPIQIPSIRIVLKASIWKCFVMKANSFRLVMDQEYAWACDSPRCKLKWLLLRLLDTSIWLWINAPKSPLSYIRKITFTYRYMAFIWTMNRSKVTDLCR